MEVIYKEDGRGTIITPFFHEVYNKKERLEVNFSSLAKETFSFAKYGVIQFIIEADSLEKAVELAKDRINLLFPMYPKQNEIIKVTGFKYNNENVKVPFELSFMENTHHQNQFTANSYKTKIGDLLRYDCDGDGWGFWYIVDDNGKRISERLKGKTFLGAISDGIITKK